MGTGQLWRGKQEVKVTPKAFTALRYFLDHPGQLVTKDDLFAAVWPQTIVTEATLASCIQELRKALQDNARDPQYIETVYRRGLRFIGKVVSNQQSLARSQEGEKQKPESQFPVPTAQSLPLPDNASIIVLPFTNMSEDPKQEYFNDGITEDLTSSLSRIHSLFVIFRNSAFTYKGKAVKIQEVSREMGVRYVLEGSVRREGDQLRITAQLLDGTTGGHVWSERYDRLLRDIFALQDEITQQIVAALRVEIGKAELIRVRRIPTENLTAYDLYLRGLESSIRVGFETKKEANAHARQMFEKAVELDPMYAEASVGLSWTYFNEWFYQWASDRAQALGQALEIAQRAVALDDSLPGAYRVLGYVYLWKRQYEQAIVAGQRAIALDPNDFDGYGRLGTILIFVGQPEEGIRLIEKAIRFNPYSSLYYLNALGLAHLVAGRYEEARASLTRLLAHNPNMMIAHVNLAICYVELAQLAEARATGTEIMRLNPNWSLEFIRHAPWKDPVIIERHVAALRKAGLK